MSQVGIEAKTASAPQITNILQNSDIVKNNDKKDFVLYDGSSLVDNAGDNELIAGHYSHRSHYSHSSHGSHGSHGSHYSSRF